MFQAGNIHSFEGPNLQATTGHANDWQTFESTCKMMKVKELEMSNRDCSEYHREVDRQKVVSGWILEDVKS